MSEYKMSIKGKITLEDYSSIYDYIAIVNKNDKLTIVVDSNENENVEIVCNMLKNKYFTVNPNRPCDGGKYCIKAFKNED
ncbi:MULTISPECIES: hypothetical protein [Clostridium]|uniref:Uncharacterized protein n=4 Tax=Clostridium TaxID=1485 RepID=D8GJ71_CLOLD|nr:MULTISPECIES: hypothetical protein [Clostridium]ADK17159.1 conserved hypothetical protein [Clostridium ljungdahlii DSM 13528]AGY76197.1 hypothetical protein CAETHG_1978 [Clostridium autoethanogenum DSM 10061]ALU36359.1 Hypothetical protein CLAU_1930 [Clostridium autoethanogenum DSM 10061]OAA83686.1 hypothetical protein WX45_02075 [Clostridium ljungdahlii DSM 13528]OAA94780.1 hypothetical protein WX73_01186 [Clostridium coskatii]